MSMTQIRSSLDELNLYGMVAHIEEVSKKVLTLELSFEEALDKLMYHEKQYRTQKAMNSRVIRSKIRKGACLEEFDLSRGKRITKNQVKELSKLEWCSGGIPLVLIGPTGVGKTYLARALGLLACESGRSVLFMSVTDFIENQILSRSTNTYLRFREKLTKPDLLILDDFGMRKLSSQEAEDLRDILEQRSYGKSTMLTTQLPIDHWSEVIGDEIILDALIDRIESPGIIIKMEGESYRKKTVQKEINDANANQLN
jgi:DNA replication protein DnaC